MKSPSFVNKQLGKIILFVFCGMVIPLGCVGSKDFLPDYPDYPKGFFYKKSTTPYSFLVRISSYFFLYKQKTGVFPKEWSECSLVLSDYDDALRETLYAPGEFIVADRDLVLEKSTTLITYDRMATKKYFCKYMITRSEDKGFEVTAQGNYFPYVWATDGFHIWHYYKNSQEEDRIVEELHKGICSFFISRKEREALMSKLITLRNDKALAYYVSYFNRFKNNDSMIDFLTSEIMYSSIITNHVEYREKLRNIASQYQNNENIQLNIKRVLQSFNNRSEKVYRYWPGVESWVFNVPYGINPGVSPY